MRWDLGFIGAGNMAEALCRGVISAGLFPAERIAAGDPSEARRRLFAETLGVHALDDNAAVVNGSPTVVLAVKPQAMDDVLAEIGPLLGPERRVISIAAGVRIGRIESACRPGCRVVRTMPNTPLLVGAGMSALAAGTHATSDDLEAAARLFRCAGEAVIVDEAALDAVTAVSGSGPAYFFYLVEAMTEAGVAEGLERDLAAKLAAQTLLGAGRLLVESPHDAAELRRRVTSPGGTTEAALGVMREKGVREALVAAVRRAAERSRELAGG